MRRRAAALLVSLPLAAIAGATHAIGLGEITLQSGLGRPLRIVVPVIAAAGEEISGECFRLAPPQRSPDGIPEVLTARIALQRTGAGARLVVTTSRPVDDPVVKVTLQAGCDSVVRREYTLLLDPLPVEAPVAAEAARPAADTAARPSASPGAVGGAETRGPAPVPPGTVAPRSQNRRPAAATGTTAAAAAAAAPTGPRPGAAPAPKPPRKPPVAAAPQPAPKLTVSTAVPGGGGPGKGAAGDATAREQQELANTLEAETIVLRQRVAELTATVDRMQQEIVAAQALQAARTAAADAAKASPQATIGRWWSDGWPVLATVIGLAVLIAAGLSLRRRRTLAGPPALIRDAAPAERAAPARPEPPRPPAGARDAVRAVPQAPPPRQGPDRREQSTAVAVSELSHITEEAGIYLAFNRVDRAIEVLQLHVRTVPASLPAAWMMLLDLYRKQGLEKEFRELAEQFHVRFNAAVPSWESLPPPAEDDLGLESLPHIVRQVVESWGTAECRALLDRLLHDNRDGRRAGFSLAAYEDLLFLRQLAGAASGDAGPTGGTAPARRAPRPATAAGAVAAATPTAANKLPLALDLELELDKDMLESAKRPRSSGDPPKRGNP